VRAAVGEDDLRYQQVDAALQAWRQGDYVLGEQWFIYRFDPALPLTEESAALAGEGIDLAEVAVRGFVVVTQTCDIVRKSRDRYFIEVAPIVEVPEHVAHEIERGRRPSYAIIPTLRDQQLVADLDRTMTVERAVVTRWQHRTGCLTEEETRKFSLALARKRRRYAFPDDFTAFARKLTDRLLEKHDRQSDEGGALRALREIRVHASPSWDAEEVKLTFWFIHEDSEVTFEGMGWDVLLNAWLQLIPASGRFKTVDGAVVALEDLTAKDYVESDPLDLDYLSTREA
jgi:hypothetical protein